MVGRTVPAARFELWVEMCFGIIRVLHGVDGIEFGASGADLLIDTTGVDLFCLKAVGKDEGLHGSDLLPGERGTNGRVCTGAWRATWVTVCKSASV